MRCAATTCLLLVCVMSCDLALPTLAHPPCPQTCGPSGASDCCASPIVPGNAAGATLAGQLFYRNYDTAMDLMYADKTAAAQVSDFRLDTYEVTVERFRAFVNAGMGTSATAPAPGAGAHPRIPGSGWSPTWNANLEINTEELVAALKCDSRYQTWSATPTASDNRPMNCLTWYEAMAFCIWDGGYLPTEAEWNYAASGGNEQRPYPWASDGSTTVDCTYADYAVAPARCVVGGTNRVGSESPKGDGRWGQADLAGNLFEWNLDWFTDTYPGPPCSDCAHLADRRVYRGGAFASTASSLRVAVRTAGMPAERSSTVGVRCARTGPASAAGPLRYVYEPYEPRATYPSYDECQASAIDHNNERWGDPLGSSDMQEFFNCRAGPKGTGELWWRHLDWTASPPER